MAQFGQMLLGIELGQKMNMSVISIFKENWLFVGVMLLLSVMFAMLSGFVLWRFSKTDMLTSFVGTAPGGLSAMPGIAQEVGANTAIVRLVQTIRVLFVVMTIPFFVFFINAKHPDAHAAGSQVMAAGTSEFEATHMMDCVDLLGGFGVCKAMKLRFPAPWLLGSMTGAAVLQIAGASMAGSADRLVAPRLFSAVANLSRRNDRLKDQQRNVHRRQKNADRRTCQLRRTDHCNDSKRRRHRQSGRHFADNGHIGVCSGRNRRNGDNVCHASRRLYIRRRCPSVKGGARDRNASSILPIASSKIGKIYTPSREKSQS